MTTRSSIVRGFLQSSSIGLAMGVWGCAPTPINVPQISLEIAGRELRILAVDVSPGALSEIHGAMDQGTALVRVDAKGVESIARCTAPGEYSYLGQSARKSVITLRDAVEVVVNLPTQGRDIVPELGASFGEQSALSLGLVTVGAHSTPHREVGRAVLRGEDCTKATHFVAKMYVGAFGMATFARGAHPSVDALLAKGASATEKNAKFYAFSRRSGLIESCAQAVAGATDPPADCAVPLMLELVPIDAARPVDDSSCASGYVRVEGRCVAGKHGDAGALCASSRVEECERQCAGSSDESCLRAARVLLRPGVAGDELTRGQNAAQTACERGESEGCARAAAQSDPGLERAAEPLRTACDGGSAWACFELALRLDRGASRNAEQVAGYYDRACRGGELSGCLRVARLVEAGDGVARDHHRAEELLEPLCEQGEAGACEALGWMDADGVTGVIDAASATKHFELACQQGSATSCRRLASWVESGIGRDDIDQAKGWYQRAFEIDANACSQGDFDACLRRATALRRGLGTSRDVRAANELLERGCTAGHTPSCVENALAVEAAGTDVARRSAISLLKSACDRGNAHACGLVATRGGAHGPGTVDSSSQYSRACQMGDGPSCVNLLMSRRWGEAANAEPKEVTILASLDRHCHEHDAGACEALGSLAQDPSRRWLLLERACRDDAEHACGLLSSSIYGLSPAQIARLLPYLRHGCLLGDDVSCQAVMMRVKPSTTAGGGASTGVSGSQNQGFLSPQLASKTLQLGCDRGTLGACVMLGTSLRSGSFGAPDYAGAARALEPVCSARKDDTCGALAELYRTGGAGLTASPKRARELLAISCANEPERDSHACALLGAMQEKGEGGAADSAGAIKSYLRGCDENTGGRWGRARMDGDACAALGKAYEVGAGVQQHRGNAFHFKALACALGASEMTVCTDAAKMVEASKDADGFLSVYREPIVADNRLPVALDLYTSGCDRASSVQACLSAAKLYEKGGKGLKSSTQEARYYKRRACELGDAKACASLK